MECFINYFNSKHKAYFGRYELVSHEIDTSMAKDTEYLLLNFLYFSSTFFLKTDLVTVYTRARNNHHDLYMYKDNH